MAPQEYDVQYPQNSKSLDQNEEWIMLVSNKKKEKIRLHDYKAFFKIPGLYESVVYDNLKCCSPITICALLMDCIEKKESQKKNLRVLDFGAGNGMIADCLRKMTACQTIVGLDIIDEARDAAFRDYPGTYDDYWVMDLSNPSLQDTASMKQWNFNTLVTVAALGYGDIPTQAFMNAFNLVQKDGWIAFNIKERFVSEDDNTGFKKVLQYMTEDCMELHTSQRYCHRLSLSGEPLFYHAVIAQKKADIKSPEKMIQAMKSIPN